MQKHFGSFYDHYEKGVDGATDKMGVWISGFFGSGKSHFLKILSSLLANDRVAGKRAIDYFEDKFAYDRFRYDMMCRIGEVPTEVILFNIDAKSPMGKSEDVILRVFTKVFYEHCGFYGDDLKVAFFERFLARQGKLEAFKDAFQRLNGESWESTRDAFAFWEEDIVTALTETTGISESAAHNWFTGEETNEISIDRLAREILEYVESKGPNFHLVFLVDEMGQYIGDNSSLMLNLQTVVEELGAKCRGKVWVIVTSQEDIDKVTRVRGNDFSKIQGRFNTRLSLSSASVDEVIKRRILEKLPTAEPLLRLVYQQNASVLKNLIAFSQGTVADLKGYASEEEFVVTYPFVPYQFRLMQEVLTQVRKHGSSGKSLSGGERSMLSAFQEAAQAVKDRDENALVPFYRFYDTIHTFLEGAIRRVIDRADQMTAKGEGLKPEDVDVLKLLFLIRYVDGIPSNVENLSTLMVDNIQADKIVLRKSLHESLDRLVRENFVSRNGEIYMFLTDEEQDTNREIRAMLVDQTEVVRKIGETIFTTLYPGKKFRYRDDYDFAYDPMIDDSTLGMPSGEIKLRFVTAYSQLLDNGSENTLVLKSQVGNEAIVLLSADFAYDAELEEALKIDKYVKQRNVSQLPESMRRIISAKQEEAKARTDRAEALLREAILKGTYYVAGERCVLKGATVKERLDAALTRLIEDVYSKLGFVDSITKSESDLLPILRGTVVQETLTGAEPNARALDDLRQFMDIKSTQHVPVTMSDIQKRYKAIPYGWREIDVAAQVAALVRSQRLQLTYGGAIVPPADRRALDCIWNRAEAAKTVVKLRVSPPEEQLRKARKLAGDLFNLQDLKSDEENLCGQIKELLTGLKDRIKTASTQYNAPVAYPGSKVVENGARLVDGVLVKSSDNVAFLTTLTETGGALLDWKDDFAEVEFFFKNQKAIFDAASKQSQKVTREINYFVSEEKVTEAFQTIKGILEDPRPYRHIVELPTLSQIIAAAYDRINSQRRERVQETIVQARGDIHTLAGDDLDLKSEVIKADQELENRGKAAMESKSPVELDAIITQILSHKDAVCERLEKLIASKRQPTASAPRALKVKTLRRYDVLPQKRLASVDDIDAYVAQLKATLTDALKECDAIQLN